MKKLTFESRYLNPLTQKDMREYVEDIVNLTGYSKELVNNCAMNGIL